MESTLVAKGLDRPATANTDPDFINYLFDPKEEYNCYFIVGNPDLDRVERIGVVKKMLLAHSVVLRAQLKDSKIAEKDDVKVKDIFPQTFKNLLRYVYGYDNTAILTFDETDDLLYAAEKYQMLKLKNLLSLRLMSMLNASNICSLMNNPVCFTVLELNTIINEILQFETEQVLASPQFLDLSSSAFLRILEQEVCNVPEIELWSAAINWAKRQGNSDGQVLRDQLDDHLQHIRVCSMDNDDIFLEVIPSKVLTYEEVALVCESRKTGQVQPELTTICNVIKKRDCPVDKSGLIVKKFILEYASNRHNCETTFTLTTRPQEATIELCSVTCGLIYIFCTPTLSITRDTDTVAVCKYKRDLTLGEIPVIVDGENVQLAPNSSYSFSLWCSCNSLRTHATYCVHSKMLGHHFSVDFQTFYSNITAISYKVLPKGV
ncbi:BTB/POZ domain-containing protein 3-like [Macrosteles quadrilineatus]|uniref:BTB/POZ domain-containing protein 3-like n=1 Tax=Macrosteles quadrilineatus TaxID=74068 RepID=UPI0023E2D78B|nr:BTB/POZ domain-containing protein 3-like [Macrosteles quadrilineatus]XP_054284866.1 BTB/POZ domain-containing protein 3-like [Macrosteles quadrilineatus]